jgi:hypothetical protein
VYIESPYWKISLLELKSSPGAASAAEDRSTAANVEMLRFIRFSFSVHRSCRGGDKNDEKRPFFAAESDFDIDWSVNSKTGAGRCRTVEQMHK